ncbi:histidine kinase dimerization/phosphoacceptor domain -containing protein [Bradyrhizobium sp. USDA 313]
MLLRQLAHQIEDELVSVIELLSEAAGRCDCTEARAMLVSVQDRLESHVCLHHALQMPQFATTIDLASYLQQLRRSISRSRLEYEGIALLLLLQPLNMSSERCWLLGMVVFELITASARHISLKGTGTIRLEVWGTANSVTCCIIDNGTTDQGRPRLSRSMVDMLVARLNGTMDVRFGPDGARTVVEIPRGA